MLSSSGSPWSVQAGRCHRGTAQSRTPAVGHCEEEDSFLQPCRRVRIPAASNLSNTESGSAHGSSGHRGCHCPGAAVSQRGACGTSRATRAIREWGRAGLLQGESPSLLLWWHWECPGAIPGWDSEAERGDTRTLGSDSAAIPDFCVSAPPQVRGGTSAMTCW